MDIGLNYFLQTTDNPKIVPVSYAEDYAVYIRHYRKKINENRIKITLEIQLRTRSGLFGIGKGRLLAKKKLTIEYDKNSKVLIKVKLDKTTQRILKLLSVHIEDVKREAYWVEQIIADEIIQMVRKEEGIKE